MKTLKTIWKKVPAWAKALIYMFIIGLTVINIIHQILQFNLQNDFSWGWALLTTILILFAFWKFITRFSSFNEPEDVKISIDINFKDIKVWSRILGLILLLLSSGVLFTKLFGVEQDYTRAGLEPFLQAGDAVAVTLIIAICLTAGIVEEVIFRGYVQNTLVRAYPKTVAFLALGLVFALVHFLPLSLVFCFIMISVCFSIVA